MNNPPLIQCHDAVASITEFEYEGDSLNFMANAGETINVIGPDYSGKSSWTKMICGIDECACGNVSIFDKPLDTYTRKDWINLRKNIAYIKADTALLSAANGLQNIMMPALYHNIDTPNNILNRAKALLEEITPDSNPQVLPAELRKDQRFKIAIARALILKPRAIVLDNPFTLLDIATAKLLKSYLLKYASINNVLIIIVSHDIQFTLEHSDKIIFVSKKNVRVFDSSNELESSDDTEINDFLDIHRKI